MDPIASEEEIEARYADMEYLDVTIADLGCGEMGYQASDFDEEIAGYPATGSDDFWEVDVDGRLVTVTGTLDEAEVDALVASLAPATVGGIVATIPDWVSSSPFGSALEPMMSMGMGMFPMMFG